MYQYEKSVIKKKLFYKKCNNSINSYKQLERDFINNKIKNK